MPLLDWWWTCLRLVTWRICAGSLIQVGRKHPKTLYNNLVTRGTITQNKKNEIVNRVAVYQVIPFFICLSFQACVPTRNSSRSRGRSRWCSLGMLQGGVQGGATLPSDRWRMTADWADKQRHRQAVVQTCFSGEFADVAESVSIYKHTVGGKGRVHFILNTSTHARTHRHYH